VTVRPRWVVLAVALALAPAAAFGQAEPKAYEVRRGDTLFGIARQVRPEGVTVHQMVLALYRANPDAFAAGNINQLRVGATLQVPDKSAAAGVEPADAARQVAALAAARPAPPAPQAVPTPAPAPAPPPVAAIAPPKPPARAPLGKEEAERRYRAGLAMERAGDDRGALQAFLEAGESGHGQAQKKLGEIYDRGNSAVARDYETALRWYQRAREQGIAVPKPETRAPAIR
jgi:pilus assembly protein FimV